MTKSIENSKFNSLEWSQINWKSVERTVFGLQKRIYQAKQHGDIKTVHGLQKILLKSWSAKLLAVRIVTQDPPFNFPLSAPAYLSKGGKGRAAGVDGVTFLIPKKRLKLAQELSLKDKVKKNPLGILAVKDRAVQALAKIALEPEWEASFEANSYGFRPGRSCHDAIEAIFTAIRYKPQYVLDAYIAKCFEGINHDYLLNKLNTFPEMRRYIKSCLKAGVMNGEVFPTTEETSISPLLANISLHGIEQLVKEYATTIDQGSKEKKALTLSTIRYADQFVIIHENLETLLKCKERVELWLQNIGLELNPSKTQITHTLEEYQGNVGFDFLGFNIRQYKLGKYRAKKNGDQQPLEFKTIIKPSKEKTIQHHRQLRDIVRKHKATTQKALISELNPIITGWTDYYKTSCASREFSRQDHLLWTTLKRWENRRHPHKSMDWKQNKYWKIEKYWQDGQYYQRKTFTDGEVTLKKHADTKIVRHTKVQDDASPYDGNWVYWSTRMGKHRETLTIPICGSQKL